MRIFIENDEDYDRILRKRRNLMQWVDDIIKHRNEYEHPRPMTELVFKIAHIVDDLNESLIEYMERPGNERISSDPRRQRLPTDDEAERRHKEVYGQYGQEVQESKRSESNGEEDFSDGSDF